MLYQMYGLSGEACVLMEIIKQQQTSSASQILLKKNIRTSKVENNGKGRKAALICLHFSFY